jgi:hypothetical protein
MTGIAMDDREEYIYVVQETRVVRYDKDGKNAKTVAGGNGHGSALNQIAYGKCSCANHFFLSFINI